MSAIAATITSASTERSIAAAARAVLAELGIAATWYYDCPAFVLLGSRSCLSLSGRDYVPADEPVGMTNLITIDLSPCDGDLWGDYARSLCIENGRVIEKPTIPEFCEGLKVECGLHHALVEFATPDASFHQLYEFANDAIVTAGYENLDFMGNVGHSIETRREHRRYIEKGNSLRLGEVSCFTFEPHIRRRGGRWGFKHEDIYYFEDGRCTVV